MYTRSFYPDEPMSPVLPENYDGTAFTDSEPIPQQEPKEEPAQTASAIPLLGGLNLPFLEGLKMPKIGTEELLIIAVAGFLLFSKNGDKECALILLFLLFVS